MRAAVLYVLQSFDEGVDYIKLFKILYFAQKEHLVKYGRGVIGDTFHDENIEKEEKFSNYYIICVHLQRMSGKRLREVFKYLKS